MTAISHGFMQIKQHEQDAREGTLYQHIDEYLEQRYGKVRPNVTPGLKWLTGLDGFPSYLDHAEYRIKDGKKTMIARPYGLYLEQIEKLVELARGKNLCLTITSPSNYNLDTVLVILTQQEHA